jgi:purine-cytosine permease-like protein
LTNFLGLFGYWGSAYVAIIIIEHLYFRKNNPSLYYDVTAWNVPQRLPSGIAAIAAGVLSFGMVIPCMSQNWFTGPIARKTGDIGFEVAFVVSGLLYFPFRWLEIRWRGFF